jgi:hypothetical protein
MRSENLDVRNEKREPRSEKRNEKREERIKTWCKNSKGKNYLMRIWRAR